MNLIFLFVLGITYLDHAGSTLFPESLLKAFTDDLRNNVYGKYESMFPLLFSRFHLNISKLDLLTCWKMCFYHCYRVVGSNFTERLYFFSLSLVLLFSGQGHVFVVGCRQMGTALPAIVQGCFHPHESCPLSYLDKEA